MEIEYLKSDWHKALLVKGQFTKEEILHQAVLDDKWCDLDEFESNSTYEQSYWRAIPKEGYECWYEQTDKLGKGAFLASSISVVW